jgi:shikimate kinase
MPITLIGYRGCGKTTLADPLADALGWTAIDADVELERRAGRTIRQIFETDGEPHFRALERDLIAELLTRDRLVLAAGGGAVLDPTTRQRMRAAGPVVWLHASAEVLAARIAADATTAARRPNLTADGGRLEVERLLAVREPLYRETATCAVSTEGRTSGQILAEVLRHVRPPAGQGAAP